MSSFLLTERSQKLQDLPKLRVEVQILLRIILLVIPTTIVLSHNNARHVYVYQKMDEFIIISLFLHAGNGGNINMVYG